MDKYLLILLGKSGIKLILSIIYQFDPQECVYFGDKIIEGGNDYEIAMICGKYHQVNTPDDTLKILSQYTRT